MLLKSMFEAFAGFASTKLTHEESLAFGIQSILLLTSCTSVDHDK